MFIGEGETRDKSGMKFWKDLHCDMRLKTRTIHDIFIIYSIYIF